MKSQPIHENPSPAPPSSSSSSAMLTPPAAPFAADELSSSPSRSRCSPCSKSLKYGCRFSWTFVSLSVIQLVVTSLSIYFIAWNGVSEVVSSIESNLRDTILVTVRDNVDYHMAHAVQLVEDVTYSTQQRFPQFGDMLYIYNVTGALADVSYLLAQPDNFFLGAGACNEHGVIFSSGHGPGSNVYAMSDITTNGTVSYFSNATGPTKDNTPNINLARRVNLTVGSGYAPLYDFMGFDSAANLLPYQTASYFCPSKDYWNRAMKLNGSIGWTPPYVLLGAYTGQYSMFAVRQLKFQGSNSKAMVFVTVFLNFLQRYVETLQMSVKQGGCVLILEPGGNLLASSRSDTTSYYFRNNYTSILQARNDPFLSAIGPILVHRNFIGPNAVTAAEMPSVNPNRGQLSGDISVGGAAAHYEATLLPTYALPWVIVVITDDNDFEGELPSVRNYLIAAMVAFIFVFGMLGVCLTQCISRPLSNMILFMESFQKMNAHDDIAAPLDRQDSTTDRMNMNMVEQGQVFEHLLDSWDQIMGILPEEKRFIANSLTDINNTNNAAGINSITSASATKLDGLPSTRDSPQSSRPAPSSLSSTSSMESSSTSLPISTCCVSPATWTRLSLVPMHEVSVMRSTLYHLLTTLVHSYKQLENANQAKRRFLRYIFHEIRVPFNAVVLGVDQLKLLLLNGRYESLSKEEIQRIQEEQDEILDILRQQSRVVANILNDVLSISAIEDGKLILNPTPFCVECLVLKTLRSFAAEFAAKHLNVTVSICHPLYPSSTATGSENLPCFNPPISAHSPSSSVSIGGTRKLRFESSTGSFQSITYVSSSSPCQFTSISPSPQSPESSTAGMQHQHRSMLADRYRLRQVIANFLSNAVKFSPESGSIHVELNISAILAESQTVTSSSFTLKSTLLASSATSSPSLMPVSRYSTPKTRTSSVSTAIPTALFKDPTRAAPASSLASYLVRVAVKDSGPGIPENEQQQLFVPYAQLSAGKEAGVGTGLGLSICKSIVDLHKGEIGVISSVGEGAEFYFQLPLVYIPGDLHSPQDVKSPTLKRSGSPRAPTVPTLPGDIEKRLSHPQHVATHISPLERLREMSKSKSMNKKSDTVRFHHPHTDDENENDILISLGDAEMKLYPYTDSNADHDEKTSHVELSHYLSHTNSNQNGHSNSSHPPALPQVLATYQPRQTLEPVPQLDHSHVNYSTSNDVLVKLDRERMTSSSLHEGNSNGHGNVPSSPSSSSSFSSTSSASSHKAAVPRRPVASCSSSSESSSSSSSSSSSTSKSSLRCLIVEDNAPSRRLLAALLRSLHYSSDTCENGLLCIFKFVQYRESQKIPLGTAEEIKACIMTDGSGVVDERLILEKFEPRDSQHIPYDVILMDGNMPVCSGISATRILRSMGVDIPIIAVSGNALEEDQDEFRAAGIQEFITKPIDRNRLQLLLSHIISQRTPVASSL